MDEQRNWAEVLAGPLAGASIGAMVVIGLALAGPGRYYGWRLQKVLDLIGGMTSIDGLDDQRRELCADAERLSRRVAAYHRVPTEWHMMIWAALGAVWTYGSIIGLGVWTKDIREGIAGWQTAAFVLSVLVAASPGFLTIHWGLASTRYTYRERLRYVHEGMSGEFHRRLSPRPEWLAPKPDVWNSVDDYRAFADGDPEAGTGDMPNVS
ncbi:hypothetical protein [Gordonia terrae]|uniref:hypothetical protein n=1 Tax=Gordonia terrae TaxID=2055 RepID=UPI0011464A37|nr:hypothetical protein [Gordonia terrae]